LLTEEEKLETVAHAYELHHKQVREQYIRMIRELALIFHEDTKVVEERIKYIKAEKNARSG